MPRRLVVDGQLSDERRVFLFAVARGLGGPRFLLATALYTLAINGLALAGPVYMLVIYERLLPARDVGVLVLITLLMLLLYALSAWLDVLRQVHMLRGARRIDRLLSARAARKRSFPIRDIDQVRAFLAGYGPSALCDLPWVPLYLVLMFLLHPLLGALTLAGALALIGLLLAAEQRSAMSALNVACVAEQRRRLAVPVSPRRVVFAANARLRDAQEAAAWPTMIASTAARAMRPALQSATLGLGAYLAMTEACQSGSVLAASIVLPRVLGPLEMALAHWRSLAAAHASALRLNVLRTSPRCSAVSPPDLTAPAPVGSASLPPCGGGVGREVSTTRAVQHHLLPDPPPSRGREERRIAPLHVRIVLRRARG
jgi:ATP-binding cassette subfamily C protein PrsD